MALDDLTADSLDVFEPQRQNNCLLFIVGLDEHDTTDGVLTLSLESFPIPKRSIGVVEAHYLNEMRKYAGKVTYDDVTIVYKDFCNTTPNSVGEIVNGWWLQVNDSDNGKTGFAADYKKNGYVRMYSPEGSITRQWNCYGIWPSSFDPGDADMAAEDFMRINLTLTVDKVKIGDPNVVPPAYG